MSTQQTTLNSGEFATDEDDYTCPLCGKDIDKPQLSSHISSDDCNPEYKEVNHDY